MTSFRAPRLLAAFSAACLLAAVFIYPLGVQETGGLLCAALAAGWLSHDTSRVVRENRAAILQQHRSAYRALAEILNEWDEVAA